MTTTARDPDFRIAVSLKIPESVRLRVPEALKDVSSRTVSSVPPSAVLLLMSHPGPCELIDAATDAGLVCLQVLDPATSPPRIMGHPDDTDDFIFLGASRSEIMWRAAHALERRESSLHPSPPDAPEVLVDGLRWTGRFVPLSATEVRLARRLIEDRGAVVPRDELNRLIGHYSSEKRAVEAHLYRLRHKLRDLPGLRIQTVRQRGYRLDVMSDENHTANTASTLPRVPHV